MEGHRIFYVTLDVTFVKPLVLVDKSGRCIKQRGALGYIQEMGCTAATQLEMQEMVRSAILSQEDVDESNEIIHFDRIGEIAPKDVQKEIYLDDDIGPSLLQDPHVDGIWYRTGRAFYH